MIIYLPNNVDSIAGAVVSILLSYMSRAKEGASAP